MLVFIRFLNISSIGELVHPPKIDEIDFVKIMAPTLQRSRHNIVYKQSQFDILFCIDLPIVLPFVLIQLESAS